MIKTLPKRPQTSFIIKFEFEFALNFGWLDIWEEHEFKSIETELEDASSATPASRTDRPTLHLDLSVCVVFTRV